MPPTWCVGFTEEFSDPLLELTCAICASAMHNPSCYRVTIFKFNILKYRIVISY